VPIAGRLQDRRGEDHARLSAAGTPRDPHRRPGLEWRIWEPVIKCGQQSLAVFCVGVFLSFVGHFVLSLSYGSVWAQIGVSLGGIAIMTAVAYYISWSKQQDKPSPKPAPAAAS